ncbi:MAG: 4'-phosphopantetheinyl transferase superfamily protein [Steroidobacteraceae bacterium]
MVAELDPRQLLDEGEREQAARFVFDRDRVRYVAAHVQLRCILGAYLGMDPAALRFAQGLHGRPLLAGPPAGRLEFNLSHSAAVALLAVAHQGPLGADVEALREVRDWRDLAAHYFTVEEGRSLEAPGEQPERAFLRCWTRKEAALKSTGIGLSQPPREVQVGAGPGPGEARVRAAVGSVTVAVDSFAVPAAALGAWAVPPGVRVTEWLEYVEQ